MYTVQYVQSEPAEPTCWAGIILCLGRSRRDNMEKEQAIEREIEPAQ